MFTGIIEDTGVVKKLVKKGIDAQLEIDTTMNLDNVKVGDSIAISGVCLTVIDIKKEAFTADVSAETLARTTLKSSKTGDRVNLEKALKMDSFLGGHFVLGHVDGIGKICEKSVRSNSIIFGFETEKELDRYIVQKGSITVDGISLTVNRCEKNRFYVNIIPHTARETTLGFKNAGDAVNVETDILGKYVERFIHPDKEIDKAFLSEHGFIK
ncbi:MAG: riboflavin synthase [Thermodesulfobacteriota bacterium]|nr:riboflavin synthase [Thermodesulfobacteriota bacterium]